jgi:hypothetical protein
MDGRDPELAEATRRRQRAFAYDIGDEQALARVDQPRYRRPRVWLLVLLLVVAVVGGFQALRHRSGGVHIAKSCTVPAVKLAVTSAPHGGSVDWAGTGPASGKYALVVDGTPKAVDDKNRLTVARGTAASGTFRMSGCLVHSTFQAPDRTGQHTVKLYHRTNQTFQLVAQAKLQVT